MQYYDEMDTKFGFSDGDAIPPDAEARREVYVKAINHIAEALGSGYRIAPYDRGGLHNWCLVVVHHKDGTVDEAISTNEPRDAAFNKAVAIAHELDLDEFVHTITITKEEELQDLLSNLDMDEWEN